MLENEAITLTGGAGSCGTVVLLHPRQEQGAPGMGSPEIEHSAAENQVP